MPRKTSAKSAPTGSTPTSTAERLLVAAVEAFGDRGYVATTTRQIAEHAGMSPAGMYIHFPSKQEMLYQVMLRGHTAVLEVVEAAIAEPARADLRIRRFVEAFTTWHAVNHRAARVQQYELQALAPAHYEEIRGLRGRFRVIVGDILTSGVEDGSFRIEDDALDTTTRAILSLGIDVARWYRPKDHPDATTLGAQYGDLVLAMLGVAPRRRRATRDKALPAVSSEAAPANGKAPAAGDPAPKRTKRANGNGATEPPSATSSAAGSSAKRTTSPPRRRGA